MEVLIQSIKNRIASVYMALDVFNNLYKDVNNVNKDAIEITQEVPSILQFLRELIDICSSKQASNLKSLLKDIDRCLFDLCQNLRNNQKLRIHAILRRLKRLLPELRFAINSDNALNLSDERNKELTQKLEYQTKKTQELEALVNNYNAQLSAIQAERNSLLEELNKTNEEAKRLAKVINDTLKPSTAGAVTLNTSFQDRFNEVSKKQIRIWWLIGAGSFLAATILIGSIILFGLWFCKDVEIEYNDNVIVNLVGRLSMMSITMMGAVFCANQYTKQKTLIEDYAYKAAIAKSIAAFSEELREKSPEEYSKYIALVTKEIYQDPLRKRGKEKEDLKKSKEDFTISEESLGLIEKIIKIAKIQDTNS